VLISYNQSGDNVICKTMERKSKFTRNNIPRLKAGYTNAVNEQVVAANFDYVFIIASLNFDFNINRIQRYLTVAWQSGGIPVVVLTKADLIEDYSEQLKAVQKIAIGVYVVAVSAKTGFGLDKLSEYLKPAKTLVFIGSSGVGKSSLVNALAGEKIMVVNEIREDDSKGRHTTTHRQLIKLGSGVMIIDTPGMRELGMLDISEGLGEAFADIEELFCRCKFTNCTHRSEPNCAILEALANGTLEQSRWENYLKLKREARFMDQKGDIGAMQERKQSAKKYSKMTKDMW
jgi:ribosome biogenesis GTPase